MAGFAAGKRDGFSVGQPGRPLEPKRDLGEEARLSRTDRQEVQVPGFGRSTRAHQPSIGREAHPESRSEAHGRGAVDVPQVDGPLLSARFSRLVEEDPLAVAREVAERGVIEPRQIPLALLPGPRPTRPTCDSSWRTSTSPACEMSSSRSDPA